MLLSCLKRKCVVTLALTVTLLICKIANHSESTNITGGIQDGQTESTKSALKIIAPNDYSTVDRGADHKVIFQGHTRSHCHPKDFKRRFPDVIMIGERKCSTFATMKFLADLNPRIRWTQKEAHFFNNNMTLTHSDLERYKTLMAPSCPDDVTMEKTPNYFRLAHVPGNIFTWNKHVKLLLSLRDPIQRAVSEYHFLLRKYKEGKEMGQRYSHYAKGTFEDLAFASKGHVNVSFEPLVYSQYDIFLKHWLEVFPMKQIHIVDADAVIHTNPASELLRIESFLGLPPRCHHKWFVFNNTKGFYCVAGRPCLSKEKGHRHPPLRANVTEKLEEFFKSHMKNLYNLTGIHLSWMTRYL